MMLFHRSPKPSHIEVGKFGEEQAAAYLKKHGYRIVARNFRAGHHELDIVAESREEIVFVEVKTRCGMDSYQGDYGTPASAVTRSKRRFTVSAARAYLYKNPTEKVPRFDVIEVYLEKPAPHAPLKVQKLEHLPDAYLN